MKELVLKKCNKCGALVKVLVDCNCDDCNIMCCNSNMITLRPNSVDASFEKHVPTYEVDGDVVHISVNHVMEDDHYIQWICVVANNEEKTVYFKSGDKPCMDAKYVKGSVIYTYCNKHGLWMKEVE